MSLPRQGIPKTITEIQGALDGKKLSSVELTTELLKAARATKTNAFLTLCEERALQQARDADVRLAREGQAARAKAPFLGVPLAFKDNIVVEGVRTTCGSKILENYVPPYSATAARRLEGAVLIGKTNLDEFGMGGSNENSAYGKVLHPTHPDRVPGGSSGGSAAAVRAGLCAAALGSDTGGSIRLPASYCGLVGVKPTYGRVSRYGLVAFASSLDQIGPLAHTVEDAATLLDAMSGQDAMDSTSAQRGATRCREALTTQPDFKKLRIGIPKEYFGPGLSPDVSRAIHRALDWYKSEGAELKEVSLPHTEYSVAVYYVVAVSEASSNLARFDGVRFGVRPPAAVEAGDLAAFYKATRTLFGAEVKRRIILGTFALSAGYSDAFYHRACQVRRLIKQDFGKAFEQCDLIAGPVSTTAAYKFGEHADPLSMYLNDIFTIPANLAGVPALSLPVGEDSQGLPVGMHLIAPHFGEERLLQAAHAFETRGAS